MERRTRWRQPSKLWGSFAGVHRHVLWEYDSNRDFETANGTPGRDASILGPSPTIAGGMVFVNSGYGSHGRGRGNVLLAFGVR